MTLEHAETMLMWATILGMSLLTASGLLWAGLRPRLHVLRGRLYGISPEVADIIAYAWLGVMKLVVLMCFLVPWLALVIAV